MGQVACAPRYLIVVTLLATYRTVSMQSEGPKLPEYFNLKRKYAILSVGGENRLIKKEANGEYFRYVIASEEVHSALMAAHSAVGHVGEKKKLYMKLKKMGQHNNGML